MLTRPVYQTEYQWSLTLKRPNLGVGTTKPALFNRAISGLRADFQQSKTKESKLTLDFSIAPGAGVGFEALPSTGLTYHSTPILPAPSTSGGLPSDEDDHFKLSSGTSTLPTNNISTGIKGQLSKWMVWLEFTAVFLLTTLLHRRLALPPHR